MTQPGIEPRSPRPLAKWTSNIKNTKESYVFTLHVIFSIFLIENYISVMALEGVTKRTEHHGYSIGIYLQEQRMVTRT